MKRILEYRRDPVGYAIGMVLCLIPTVIAGFAYADVITSSLRHTFVLEIGILGTGLSYVMGAIELYGYATEDDNLIYRYNRTAKLGLKLFPPLLVLGLGFLLLP